MVSRYELTGKDNCRLMVGKGRDGKIALLSSKKL